MVSYKEAVKLLKEDGEFHPYQTFYVFGNSESKKILLFEKLNVFLQFIKTFSSSYKFYSICSIGVPSKRCLEHLKKFKNKQIFYFGDLDATSIWIYLTILFGDRKFGKNSKKKFNVKFTGLTPNDYKEFMSKRDVKIKIKDNEKRILEFIKQIDIKVLSDKISFLGDGYKMETEALFLVGFDKYFKSKMCFL